jgi:hypothetical protein
MLLGRESSRCVRRDAVVISYLETGLEKREKQGGGAHPLPFLHEIENKRFAKCTPVNA